MREHSEDAVLKAPPAASGPPLRLYTLDPTRHEFQDFRPGSKQGQNLALTGFFVPICSTAAPPTASGSPPLGGFKVWGSGREFQGARFRVHGSGFTSLQDPPASPGSPPLQIEPLGFMVQGSSLGVWGAGFRVWGPPGPASSLRSCRHPGLL